MSHHAPRPEDLLLTRREALCRGGMGFGALALGSILAEAGLLAPAAEAAGAGRRSRRWRPRPPQFAPKAKRVVHLFMNGGPSHVDTFDPKPMLTKYHGKPLPSNLPTERKTGAAFGSPFSFKKYGQSGIEVSELFANVGECADDLCVIRSMHADVPNHEPSLMLMNCGDARQPRPSVGSWVALRPRDREPEPPRVHRHVPVRATRSHESQNWQSGFLPGVYQGTYIDTQHTDIEKLIANIKNRSVGNAAQRGAARPALAS